MTCMSRTVWSSVVNMITFGLALAALDFSPRASRASMQRQAAAATSNPALTILARLNPCTSSSCWRPPFPHWASIEHNDGPVAKLRRGNRRTPSHGWTGPKYAPLRVIGFRAGEMGFFEPSPPPFELEEWKAKPHLTRLKPLVQDWGMNGFGSPTFVYFIYVLKLILFSVGALLVISLTPGLGTIWNLNDWWTEPIVFQKLAVWLLLWEILGLGAGSMPLSFRF